MLTHYFKNLYRYCSHLNQTHIRRATAHLFTEHGLTTILGLGSAYVLANYLSKDTFGTYQFVLTITGILSVFALTGTGEYIMRNAALKKRAIIDGVKKYIFFGIPAICLGLIIAATHYQQEELAVALAVSSGLFILASAFQLYSSYWVGRENFKIKARLTVLHLAVTKIALIGTVLITDDLITIVVSYYLSNCITGIVLSYISIRNEAKHFLEEATDSVAYSFHISINKSLREITKKIDKLLIFYLLGPVSLAVYAIATLPLREINRLPIILRQLIFPRLYKHNYRTVIKDVPKKTAIVFLVSCLLVGTYALIAPTAFSMLFPAYPEALTLSLLASLVLLFVPHFIFDQVLIAFEKTKELYFINTTSLVVTAIATPLCIIYFGLPGAVFAKITGLSARIIVTAYIYVRERKDV